MTELDRLKSRQCYRSAEDDLGMIEVKTCMDETCEVCCLSEGETGIQKIGITNWRSRLSDIEVRIRSVNKGVKINPTGADDVYEHVETVTVPPSKFKNKQVHKMEIPAERETEGTSTSETIQISMTIDCEDALEDPREGPTLHSEISFV